jgi:tetratricopeptide (TPR) repeat protein
MSAKLDALREALAVSPDNPPLLLLYAQGCLDEWLLDEARAVFEKILTRDPAHADAQLGVARVLHLAGKTSEAAVRLEGLLARNPRHTGALVLLARLELIDGNRDSARARYESALKLDPTVKDAALESELYARGSGPESASEPPRRMAVGPGGVLGEPPSSSDEDRRRRRGASRRELEQPKMNFGDVGGMDAVKDEIRRKIIFPLQIPPSSRPMARSWAAACCSTVRRVAARRCSRARPRARSRRPSFPSVSIRFWTCGWAIPKSACTSFSRPRGGMRRRFFFSMKSMRWLPIETTSVAAQAGP